MSWPNAAMPVQRVVAFRLDNLGDVIMTGPALRTLRQAMPEMRLTLYVSRAGQEAAGLLPWVDEIRTHRAVWQDASGAMPLDPQREMAFVDELRSQRFDAAVIFTSFRQSPYPVASACYLAGIPVRLGQSKEFGGSILKPWIRPLPDATHQVDRNLHLLEAAGFATAGRHLELRIPDEAQASADALLAGRGIPPGAPLAVLAPGASCRARTYPLERFRQLGPRLIDALGVPVVVVGGPREVEPFRIALPWKSATNSGDTCADKEPICLTGETSVAQLAAILRRARLLVASHSGPMHLADAVGCPMVILFAGTDLISQWEPRRSRSVILQRSAACAPCYRFECPFGLPCLDVPVREVVDRAVEVASMVAH